MLTSLIICQIAFRNIFTGTVEKKLRGGIRLFFFFFCPLFFCGSLVFLSLILTLGFMDVYRNKAVQHPGLNSYHEETCALR